MSQEKVNFYKVDLAIQKIKSTTARELAANLTAGYSTEIEKTRAIFRWIADNIVYRTRDIARFTTRSTRRSSLPEDTGAIKPVNERVAESVLESGYAICDGYARLFKALCDFSGIRNEIIHGYARGSRGARRFGANHSWNAVMIDNKWYLMDVTWASGYVSLYGDRFIQDFDDSYFMAMPEKFIEEHYPDNMYWTLMEDPPVISEFKQSPYKHKTFTKYRIKSYKPSQGQLEVNEGDTLLFELNSSDYERDHQIYSDLYPDPCEFENENSVLLTQKTSLNGKTSYIYHANSSTIKWVYLLYNEDVVMRYRVIINKPKEGLASSD